MVQEIQKKVGKVWLGCGLAALVVMLLAAGVLFRATLRLLPWQQSVPALLALWALGWSGLYALCSLPRLAREDCPRAAAVVLCGILVLRWAGAYYTHDMTGNELGLFGLLCEYRIMGRGIFLMVVSLLMPRLYRFNEEQLRLPWLERALRLVEWAVLTLLGVEFAGFSNALRQMSNWKVLLNVALLILLCLALYGLIGRLYLAVCLWSAVLGVGAVANYYVWQFRGFPIMASDLLALGTATKVMNSYQYSLSYKPVLSLLYILAACVLAAPLRKMPIWNQKGADQRDGNGGLVKTLLKRLACIALGVGAVVVINLPSGQKALALKNYSWAPDQYASEGFVLSFLDGIGRMGCSKPDSYSNERLENLEETYLTQETAAATILPNIIVVMNESLCDLEEFEDFAATEAVAPFMYSLRGLSNTLYGYVQVPVFGGGTSKTEFEFLTGVNDRTFSSGAPYQCLVSHAIQALPTTMKKLGYTATALHPNASGNWSRDLAYPRLGFDTFISQAEMTYTDLVRSYISDASFFAEIKDALAASDEPLFLFGVTMQDHGGYEISDYEEPLQIVSPEGEYPKAIQYINLVHESDSAFGDFIAYCETLTEPTVVLMFGDHFPSIEDDLLNTLQAGETTGTEPDELLLYHTSFYLWANFELDKDALPEDGSLLSISFLQTVLLDAAKLPKNGYQQFLTDLRDTYPVVSASCVVDADGNVVSDPDSDLLADYDTLQYALLKGLGSFAN